jgi:hypothetical protein
MRYFWLIGLFVLIAQESWAFVVSDTLIIDGEVVHLEEREAELSDSLNQSRKNDFKEKSKPIIWGIDAAYVLQLTDFSISNKVNPNLISVGDFIQEKSKLSYHNSWMIGGYTRIHKNIELGIAVQGTNGAVSVSNAEINSTSNTLSFDLIDQKIQQIYEVEVQPQVFESDTLMCSIYQDYFKLKSIQIPLKLRFYVNDFSIKSRWRAFGEISPVYRSFSLKRNSTDSSQMLFINAAGSYEFLNYEDVLWKGLGVWVGAGSEFFLSKKVNAYVQANWNFPPMNASGLNELNHFTQYSNLFIGFRILMNDGK